MNYEEYWVEVEAFPRYAVSNHGQVAIQKTGWVLRPYRMGRGYYSVGLWRHNQCTKFLVHRLVANAFIGDIDGFQINHIDGIKTNNVVWNLEIVTQTENMRHARGLGLFDSANLTHALRVEIVETGEVFESVSACARAIGGRPSTISKLLSGVGRKHLGYTFRYADEDVL